MKCEGVLALVLSGGCHRSVEISLGVWKRKVVEQCRVGCDRPCRQIQTPIACAPSKELKVAATSKIVGEKRDTVLQKSVQNAWRRVVEASVSGGNRPSDVDGLIVYVHRIVEVMTCSHVWVVFRTSAGAKESLDVLVRARERREAVIKPWLARAALREVDSRVFKS